MHLETTETPDGQTVYVDRMAGERGSKAPFYVVYTDRAGDGRWGYFCGHCETLDTAMGTMGRIQCNACGNTRKPDRWDAAHE